MWKETINITANLDQWVREASIVEHPVHHWHNSSKDKGKVEDQPPNVPVVGEKLRVSLSKQTGKRKNHHHHHVERTPQLCSVIVHENDITIITDKDDNINFM